MAVVPIVLFFIVLTIRSITERGRTAAPAPG
jgi:hypothetical protein